MFKEMEKITISLKSLVKSHYNKKKSIEKKINPEGGAEICVRFRTTLREKHDHHTLKKVALP